MFKENTFVVYKRDVCKIVSIEKNNFTNKRCYILKPVNDESLKINVPVDNNCSLRNLINKDEVEKLIKEIPNVEIIKADTHFLENIYKDLFHGGDLKDLVKIIKTTYLRNQERKETKRSISGKDQEYFEKAENYLYNEIAFSLGITYEEAKKYVISKVSLNDKK